MHTNTLKLACSYIYVSQSIFNDNIEFLIIFRKASFTAYRSHNRAMILIYNEIYV